MVKSSAVFVGLLIVSSVSPTWKKFLSSTQVYTQVNKSFTPSPQRTVIFYRQTCFHFLWGAGRFALIREQKPNSEQQHFYFIYGFMAVRSVFDQNLHS